MPGGAAPGDTYLRADKIIDAARRTGADAVHPGYGFLSENADFAQASADAGLTFVGPPPDAIRAMGSKTAARDQMARAGVPSCPGSPSPTARNSQTFHPERTFASPSLSKPPSAGAAGACASWTRLPASPRRWPRPDAKRPRSGTARLPRAPRRPAAARRFIEEAPSPAVDDALRAELCDAAVVAAKAIGYAGAGTVEFILDRGGGFYFLEVNNPPAGGAPCHRGGHRPGPRGPATRRRRGTAPAARSPGRADHRPRDRGPAVRRGRRGRVPARYRDPAPLQPP
jgi:propionyl-CoA carboxylase alpha chain